MLSFHFLFTLKWEICIFHCNGKCNWKSKVYITPTGATSHIKISYAIRARKQWQKPLFDLYRRTEFTFGINNEMFSMLVSGASFKSHCVYSTWNLEDKKTNNELIWLRLYLWIRKAVIPLKIFVLNKFNGFFHSVRIVASQKRNYFYWNFHDNILNVFALLVCVCVCSTEPIPNIATLTSIRCEWGAIFEMQIKTKNL